MSLNDKRKIVPSGGFFEELVLRIKLILKLMGDRRVSLLLKFLPVGSLGYLVWPLDIPGPIDDAALLGLAMYLFIELCPPEVVEEHLKNLRSVIPAEFRDPPAHSAEVVDGEYREVDAPDSGTNPQKD